MGVEVAKIVKERMQTLGLTYERTAELAGISRPYIAKILQGTRNPDDGTVLRLADALQMDRRELLFVTHRDRAPEEAKGFFGGALKKAPSLPKMFLDMAPKAEYVDENPYSRKYIELVKQTTRWAKEAIEKEKGFTAQFRQAQKEVANWLFMRFGDPREAKRQEKLFREFERLNQRIKAYRKKEEKKKEVLAVDFPLITDEDNRDPVILFLMEKKEPKTWRLSFEKSPAKTPFVYRVKDDSMVPSIQPKDLVIGATGELENLEELIGKVVIAKIKGLGIIVRHYNRKEKNVILTALNPAFPPHILSRGEIEWLHPIKGVYRGI